MRCLRQARAAGRENELHEAHEEEQALTDEERTRCERWTRVMGYHRPIDHFNPGKQAEFEERKYFTENEK